MKKIQYSSEMAKTIHPIEAQNVILKQTQFPLPVTLPWTVGMVPCFMTSLAAAPAVDLYLRLVKLSSYLVVLHRPACFLLIVSLTLSSWIKLSHSVFRVLQKKSFLYFWRASAC